MTDFVFLPADEQLRRAQRQDGNTVYHRLVDAGFTPKEIAKEAGKQDVNLRSIGLVLMPQPGSDVPIVGVGYGGDYRAEEEWGILEISQALSSGDTLGLIRTGVLPDGRFWLALAAAGGRGYQSEERLRRNVAGAVARSADVFYREFYEDRRKTVRQLRVELKARGVTPLPARKAEALEMYREIVRGQPKHQSVGEFHDGTWLVMLPGSELLRSALWMLGESAEDGGLRFGGSTNPFSRAIALYDERDLTAESVENALAEQDYQQRQTALASEVIYDLESKGHLTSFRPGRLRVGWYLGDGTQVEEEGDYFYIDFRARHADRVSGWFTLDQMKALAE